MSVSPVPHNKQLHRTVVRYGGAVASAPFQYSRASRNRRQRAGVELRRYAALTARWTVGMACRSI